MLSQKVTSGRVLTLLLLCFLLQIYHSKTIAQINKNGLLMLKNYSPEDYEAHDQNWAIVKDKRGVMYFGNNNGLLEYNGASWKIYNSEFTTAIMSLDIDESGNIYYGTGGGFGIIIPDSFGDLRFHSLYDGEDEFTAVRGVHVVGEKVIFRSSEKIFIYNIPIKLSDYAKTEAIETISPETSFHKSFCVEGVFYVRQTGVGLMTYKNSKLEFIEGSEIFANEKIYAMMPYSADKVLICTRESGLYLYDPSQSENRFTFFNTEANKLIIDSYVYHGVALPNNRYAISTLGNGIIIINESGKVEEQINTESGLADQMILSIYYDDEFENLWFASNESGIYKANIGSPFREWNLSNGLKGVVSDIIRFNGRIYVATSVGIFYIDEQSNDFSRLKNLKKIQVEAWDFEEFVTKDNQKRLLAGTATGVYEITELEAKLIDPGYVFRVYQSRINKDQLYVGYADGFGVIDFDSKKKKWNKAKRNENVNNIVRDVFQSESGDIFLGKQFGGILLLKGDPFNKEIVRIDTSQGLPIDGLEFSTYEIEGNIVFATMQGLFNFDEGSNKVDTFKRLGEQFAGAELGVKAILSTEGNYWLSLFSNNPDKSKWQGIARLFNDNGDSVQIDYVSSKILPQKVARAMYDDGDYFWIANDKGLYKFNKKIKKDYKKSYNLNILKVTTTDDSLLFAGTFYEIKDSIVYISLKQMDELKPELSFANNQVRFEYSALFYDQEEKTEYSYRLIGLNSRWSKWTTETKFPFTNLSPGDYRFEVKAKNIYGKESSITNYEFSIFPPWYLTIWAKALFALSAVFLVWLIVRLNVRRLKKDKERLERIVAERTTEIRMKNVELEQQKEEILAQRDEIEAQRDHVMEQKDQIEIQHNMILEQTKSITDSIHYASRIQRALLPPNEVLDEVLPEHFILYRPRDIVSGDFYWASTKNDRTIIVAADCTGHGVPGAFMSMLGISFLNEIINKFDHLHANQILNELKNSVKNSLRQTGKDNEAKDGMDMALCIIDSQKMQMEFSGAYNSLLLIRDNEMIKYEADRMPVGIYVKDRGSFTNHIIDMKEGDNYYIFSDGYPDQFGGESGSKLMIRRFKNLLMQNHQMTAAEQKAALENFIDQWQSYKDEHGKKYRQLDDILVIGMKV